MNNLSYVPEFIIGTYIFLFGICVGSFLNVVILRGLSGEDLVFARSKCPKCNNRLKWYMNIPLFSYIFLKGKCAFCKEHISYQYPIIELISGIGFVLIFSIFSISIKTLFLWIIFSLFVALCATDFKEMVIIDYHAYILLAVCLLYSMLGLGDVNIIQAVLGAVFGFVFFEIVARAGLLIIKHRIFGDGDSLIALGLGALFGVKNLFIVICLSFVIQALMTLPILSFSSFKIKKIKLALSYVLVFICMLLTMFSNSISRNIYLYFVAVLSIAMIWSLVVIINEIKTKVTLQDQQQNFCLMPFGPALIFSASICMFYLNNIKTYLIDFFI